MARARQQVPGDVHQHRRGERQRRGGHFSYARRSGRAQSNNVGWGERSEPQQSEPQQTYRSPYLLLSSS
jgi:hypothetical protein